MKASLKSWAKEEFGGLQSKLETVERDLHDLDIKAKQGLLADMDKPKRKELRSEMWKLSRCMDRIWWQKSRLKWQLQGDKNTKFFHLVAINRQSRNNINSILVNDEQIEDPKLIKQAVFNYFKGLYEEDMAIRPMSIEGQGAIISEEMAGQLVDVFTEDEIWRCIKYCDGNKAPGPDGFNMLSIKKGWYFMKKNILDFMGEFHMGEVQSAFIGGRNIQDGILIANEVVEEWKRSRKKGIIIKLDFEKAFDTVNWNYMLRMMDLMGFPQRWRDWIKECLSSARVSVIVNGSPCNEFQMHKRVRWVSDLLLAVCFFEQVSGLKINYHKSVMCSVGLVAAEVQSLANVLNCQVQNLPIKYLGLPLGANSRLKETWKPVIDKVRSRLSLWKRRNLSFGGRIVLIKAALLSLPLYYMSIFKMPECVVKNIESIQARFMWGDLI
ncbi:uncharacterized protein LOC130789694 [Actinidia eriantha]|uniref:uncharacterized protein LOC130789694 n=1 Tax=Actinidia eriantha TaxID=165200 RepID=UPI0025886783|nr:uncharacterized protein LOC130789694 [Actinidia eriantha]